MSLTRLLASAIIRSKTYGTTKFSIGDKMWEAIAIIITVVLSIMELDLLRHLVSSMKDINQSYTHEVINKTANLSSCNTREHRSLTL